MTDTEEPPLQITDEKPPETTDGVEGENTGSVDGASDSAPVTNKCAPPKLTSSFFMGERSCHWCELAGNIISNLSFLEMNHALCWLGVAKNRLTKISYLSNLASLAVLDSVECKAVNMLRGTPFTPVDQKPLQV
eukprot:1665562-Amphidinium_carterae.1